MLIAVHISSMPFASQLFQSIKFLAAQHPGIRFVIFRSEQFINETVPENIEFIIIKPLKTNLRTNFWYNYRLPSLLKKIKAGVFISEAGIASLKTTVPQWLWITGTSFLHKKAIRPFPLDAYQRRKFSRFLQTSSGVFVREAYMSEQIRKQYAHPANNFHFVGQYFYNDPMPVEWEMRNEFLETFSGGTEYFYCECNAHTRSNITMLLKAFSLFKKRLKSGLKLVLKLWDVSLEDCVKDFHLYKYRQDVIVENAGTHTHAPGQLIAASFAVIFLPSEASGHDDGLYAWPCAVPLITTGITEHRSLYKDAALYCELNEQSIADNMMLLYKDESRRSELIQRGLELSTSYTLPKVAERLGERILDAGY